MTTLQILLMACIYLVFLGVLIYFTRATARRVIGALAGGAGAGFVGLGMIALSESQGWWQVPSGSVPYFRLQLFLAFAVSMAPFYLITWRVARRFGWRGLAVVLGVVTVIGPPRDYLVAATFPEWMTFAPGFTPVLANAATYFGMMAIGHAVMQLVAGPSANDTFARPLRHAAIEKEQL